MRIKQLFLILALMSTAVALQAQSKGYFQNKYKDARAYLQNGQYKEASATFKNLTGEHKNNPFVAQSFYYFALANFKLNELFLSKNALKVLIEKYADWKRIDEAKYLLANVFFEEGNWKEAFKWMDRMNKLKDEKLSMRDHYISKLSLAELMEINRQNPEDKTILLNILGFFNKSKLTGKEKYILEYFIQEYKLDRAKYIHLLERQSEKKSVYNVGVMLPFYTTRKPTEKSVNNKYIKYYELYEGIKLAVDSLKKEGVNIRLYTYDTRRDTAQVNKILKMPEMLSMDLLVGPIVERNAKIVADFAEKNMIAYVNPVSSKAHSFFGREFVYYLEPGPRNMAAAVSKYTNGNLEDKYRKQVAIFYGEKTEDSLLSFNYRAQLDTTKFENVIFKKIGKENTKDILGELQRLNKDILNHIVFFSSDRLVCSHLIHPVEELDLTDIQIIVHDKFLDITNIEFEQLKRRNFVFIHPSCSDFKQEACVKFRAKVKEGLGSVPFTSYANYGFESMYFFGKKLNQYGDLFPLELAKEKQSEGVFNFGILFGESVSNQVVPLLKFDKDYNYEWVNKEE